MLKNPNFFFPSFSSKSLQSLQFSMQPHDLSCDLGARNQYTLSNPTTAQPTYSPINSDNNNKDPHRKKPEMPKNIEESSKENGDDNNVVGRRERPSRACTQRAAQRMKQVAAADAALASTEKKRKTGRWRDRCTMEEEEEEVVEHSEDDQGSGQEGEEDCGTSSSSQKQCSKVITHLVVEPEASQLPRWKIRSMWQLASILNFFNVFRHLLNIKVELSAEEIETALLMPNSTLAELHMPLLKAIPPITRIALGQNTWITVLCRKLRDWWYWVAEGELPIVASHGEEVDVYNEFDPGVRVVILKALCDIRVEQEDIRNYIDESIKKGFRISTFRKERVGGDSHGISYWYEEDSVIGHRLYREMRKVEVKRGKGKSVPPIPSSSYQWETVATNLNEFQHVSEKLLSSMNRTEVLIGKKLKNEIIPDIEKLHKRKEKVLKKQHREALLLDNNMINLDGLAHGRSLRDRKPITYTFDDYERSINEAINNNTKKKHPSHHLQPMARNENARRSTFTRHSSKFTHSDNNRPKHNEAEFESDDDIVGEVVYDEEHLRQRKMRKIVSNLEEEEEDKNDYLSASKENDQFPGRARREAKVDEIQSSLRRSNRATRNRINFSFYDLSDSETELIMKPLEHDLPEKSNELEGVGKGRFLDLNQLAPDSHVAISKKDEDTVHL